ncbi:MAG: putative type IV restriction endonuclease [Anaerolineaceae bacterium]|nr:MAG: putative type IV restriction endonuclease [Anaerolineaceae bacterium]
MPASEFACAQIETLVKRFKSLSAAERKGMNENATRQGYILPMFRALGWNVDNVNEVSPEEKVSRGFVDFSFRIGGIPRYFLETKKASEDLNDPRWVQQAIDYAWTKSVTWALLSDFEGLRVFNAEWKETDPFRAQFVDFNLDTYLTDFERLWWFSREETAAGRLEREADKVGKRVKRLPVSLNLFDDLRSWRSELYKSLRGYNKEYSPAQIDEAVLRLLNRLIFIRTAEDRDVEPMRLMPLLRELEDRRQLDKLSAKLNELFRQFDATYNSELFAPHFSEELYCDRPPLEALIRGLYEKNFVRYNFNALEADVLGTAYEQYLGHIVTETQGETGLIAAASHVEEKRTKRKSQGIYYTPAFVTKYIVGQTVSRWLDEHGYNPSAPPRILDMACGSGSFLIEAFDALDRFVAAQRHQAYGEEDTLHDNLRRLELLQSCIFGVDKDKQAVDVARLNLLLRALHGRQKLPLLANIYNADSLRPETWQQAFPEVKKEGGFDIIIGNPPYIRAENMPRDQRDYYMDGNNFEVAYGRFDIFILFLERAIKMLKEGGRLGFILPYPVLNENYAKLLRAFILKSCAIETIVDLSEYKVFQQASVATCIFILRKESNSSIRQSSRVKIIRQESYRDGINQEEAGSLMITQSVFQETPLNSFRLDFDNSTISILEKIDSQSLKVGDLCYVITGAVLHDPKTGESKERLIHEQSQPGYKSYIEAKDISRYLPPISRRFLEYRAKEMHRPKFPELFENDKIMVQMVAGDKGLIATYDGQKLYTDHSLHLCVMKSYLFGVKRSQIKITSDEAELAKPYDPKFLLAHINSRLVDFYFRRKLEGGLNIYPETVRQLPIRRIDFADRGEKSTHDEIVKMVEEMLALQKQHQQAKTGKEDVRFSLQKRIQALDKEIDVRVYRLYGLTEEEIKIVEGK